jgi:hypothetical protein
MITVIGKKYNLNFMIGFDGCNTIVNYLTYTHANWMILYLFER